MFGEPSTEIRQYAREYRRDFTTLPAHPARLPCVGMTHLIEKVRASDVVFIADYHPFAQAPRTALRIIRQAVKPGEKSWFIGVEMIPSLYQKELDAFCAGKISAETFRTAIRYESEWGFPWSNYAPVFEWAIAHGVRMIALNLPREATAALGSDLHGRDRWAAGVITDLFAEERARGKKPRLIALYGELHVGRRHLPKQLAELSRAHLGKKLRALSIHQNDPRLYWRLARDGRENKTQTIRLARDAFCLFSATPWAKLQAALNWAEREDPAENELDYLSLTRAYGVALAELLGLPAPSFDDLNIWTDLSAPALLRTFPRADRARLRALIAAGERFYLPASRTGYLARPSENSAAELGARHLRQRFSAAEHSPPDFTGRILDSAFAFFGSLAFNPRRKCDLAQDHATRLAALAAGEPRRFAQEKEARRIALAILKAHGSRESVAKALARKERSVAALIAARWVGQALGRSLYFNALDRPLAEETARLRKIFFSRARDRYDLFLAAIPEDRRPISKNEKF